MPFDLPQAVLNPPSIRLFNELYYRRQAPRTLRLLDRLDAIVAMQAASEAGDAAAEMVMQTNYNGPVRVLLAAARLMEPLGGCIIGISSVAGDRGRKSNYIYGSAKAGLTAFLSGLRNRLYGKVHVMTVKPGFVATRMTAGMALPPRLTAQPSEVAAAIFKAQAKGRDTVYSPGLARDYAGNPLHPRGHLQAAFALTDAIASVLMRSWTLDATGIASLMAAFIIGGLVPVPRTPMNIASGLVFGLFAVPVIAIASTVGGVIAFVAARHILQHRVRRVLERQRHVAPILRAVDLEGWRVVALLRFYGSIPTTVQNYAFGLTRISLWSFTAATLVFSIPQIAFYCYLGSVGRALLEGEARSSLSYMSVLAALSCLAATVLIVRRRVQSVLRDTGGHHLSVGPNIR